MANSPHINIAVIFEQLLIQAFSFKCQGIFQVIRNVFEIIK